MFGDASMCRGVVCQSMRLGEGGPEEQVQRRTVQELSHGTLQCLGFWRRRRIHKGAVD